MQNNQSIKKNPSLIINRDLIESVDEMVNCGELSLRSLPYGTFSEVYRIPLTGDDISVALQDDQGKELSRAIITPVHGAGIRELFGSSRIRTLEQIRGGFYSDKELNSVLIDLGYKNERKSLYLETDTMGGLFLDELMVKESLIFGIPSSGTAFVCTSILPGTPVKASVLIPSTYPHGWEEPDAFCICDPGSDDNTPDRLMMSPPPACLMEERKVQEDRMRFQFEKSEPIHNAHARRRPSPICESCQPPAAPTQITYTLPVNSNESESSLMVKLPSYSKIVGIQLMNDVSQISPSKVKIEIYLGSRPSPVASIILGDLVDEEIRPLNIACKEKEKMKIVLKFLQKATLNTKIKFQFQGECYVNQDIMWM